MPRVRVSLDRFRSAVEEAMDAFPEPFQRYLEYTEVVVADGSVEGPLGLYEGATALSSGYGMPERITIYKRPHEERAETWGELVAEVRRTVLHEVGHHFGMEEDDLPY